MPDAGLVHWANSVVGKPSLSRAKQAYTGLRDKPGSNKPRFVSKLPSPATLSSRLPGQPDRPASPGSGWRPAAPSAPPAAPRKPSCRAPRWRRTHRPLVPPCRSLKILVRACADSPTREAEPTVPAPPIRRGDRQASLPIAAASPPLGPAPPTSPNLGFSRAQAPQNASEGPMGIGVRGAEAP